jgi:hypothetical protein
MGIDASIIFNTAINLNSGTIEKYLIEEQKKSSFSPQVFFELLLSHTKRMSISKEIEHLKGRVLELTYELKIFDLEDAPTLSNLSREYNRSKKTKKLEEAKSKAINYELFNEIVNRLREQSISTSEGSPISDSGQPKKVNHLEENPLVNRFNSMPIEQVRSFFEPLIKTKNRDMEFWMTEENFDIFLRRSFGKEEFPKPQIKIGRAGKGAVMKLFFEFYEECLIESISENNSKAMFIPLLRDAFDTDIYNNLKETSFQKRDSKHNWRM